MTIKHITIIALTLLMLGACTKHELPSHLVLTQPRVFGISITPPVAAPGDTVTMRLLAGGPDPVVIDTLDIEWKLGNITAMEPYTKEFTFTVPAADDLASTFSASVISSYTLNGKAVVPVQAIVKEIPETFIQSAASSFTLVSPDKKAEFFYPSIEIEFVKASKDTTTIYTIPDGGTLIIPSSLEGYYDFVPQLKSQPEIKTFELDWYYAPVGASDADLSISFGLDGASAGIVTTRASGTYHFYIVAHDRTYTEQRGSQKDTALFSFTLILGGTAPITDEDVVIPDETSDDDSDL